MKLSRLALKCLLILIVLIPTAMADQTVSPLEKMLLDKQYPEFAEAAKEAAKEGNAEALFLLGKSYGLGWGVEIDEFKAINFYEQAAKLGSARAFNNLGLIELNRMRPYEAAKYLYKALELGLNMPTLINLGSAHMDIGNRYQNIPELIKATDFLTQAYARAPSDSTLEKLMLASANAYRFTGQVPSKIESGELRAVAIKWLDAGITKDIASAYQNYGALLFYEEDAANAIPFFEKAWERNVAEAAYGMGLIYRKGGEGVTKDAARSFYWLKIAAKEGVSEAENDVVRELENRLYSTYKMTNAELQEAIDELKSYTKSKGSPKLEMAERELFKRNTVEANKQHVKLLPEGAIKFAPCLVDIPGPNGIPLSYTMWRIVVLQNPSAELHTLTAVVSGETNERGCSRINAAESKILKQALASGNSLAWVSQGRAKLLTLQQPLLKGQLELIFGQNM